uniref:hypothetical protein n=1 Tax=Streptomyces sp. CHD11 TaxID=2741325 RepID=UPI0027E55AD1|nr:hypothetical protein [Streptomyces sp. CHD11]
MLAGSAACGTVENLSAGQKLDNAFTKLGDARSLSFELDLDADAATLKALDAESSEPGEEMPDEVAELLSDARISFSVHSKKPIDKSDEKDFTAMAVKFSGPDGDLLEYRMVGVHLYVRVDAEALGQMAGSPMPPADELPAEAGAFKKLLAGEWLKLSMKELEETRDEMSGARGPGGEPAAEPSLDARTQKKLTKALRQVFAEQVDFTTSGGSDGTEHVKATAPFRTLITELFDEIRPLQKDLPGAPELPTAKEFKDAPNKKVTADFTLKNGELTEVSVDLSKLAEKAKVKKLALVLRIGKGEKATAPAGATEVRIDEIMSGLLGGMRPVGEEGFGGGEF